MWRGNINSGSGSPTLQFLLKFEILKLYEFKLLHTSSDMKNTTYLKRNMLTMRIVYILIKFLHFMSYKSFEQKTVFLFSKEEASLQKYRKNILNFFFFFNCRGS
jgi:hypothetical protein